jgi:hypothetical protein
MMNDIILVPASETKDSTTLQVSKPSQNKEAVVIPLPVDKRLPEPLKDIPVNKWIMPPEQHGYIQANDKDCL